MRSDGRQPVTKHVQQLQKHYAKQVQRKTPKDTLPSRLLDIPLAHYISLVSHLKYSKRILVSLGAGLSLPVLRPFVALRGPGGLWDIIWLREQTPADPRAGIHGWLDAGQVDLMLVVGTIGTVWPAAIYIHVVWIARVGIAVFNTEEVDEEEVDRSQRLKEEGWFFKGDAGAVIPDVLKEVGGNGCAHKKS
ncbi:MAG: hypothetical protein LQ337_007136 [Flavoplaca oasis]|nr:MAG: hypothetical protein LQ337_007136 [Flavoplaca oasis]